MIMLVENNTNPHKLAYKVINQNAKLDSVNNHIVPITINPAIFVGKKPVAVMIADKRIDTKSWREVMCAVLQHCCNDPVYYEQLMDLRGKVAGNFRIFLSGKSDGMTNPIEIVEGLYVEAAHGSQAMMHALVNKILIPVGYDCTKISVGIRHV